MLVRYGQHAIPTIVANVLPRISRKPSSFMTKRYISRFHRFKTSYSKLLKIKNDNIHASANIFTSAHSAQENNLSAYTKYNDKIQEEADPFTIISPQLKDIYSSICKELTTSEPELHEIASYYFDGKGKAIRPTTILLLSKAINKTLRNDNSILSPQQKVGMIAEMIHTASLLHDDIIDNSDFRRGKLTINAVWGSSKAVYAGDYIISNAATILAKLGNNDVITVLSQVLVDLIQGEFMQLGSKEDEGERFTHYTGRIYRKTASLFANSCKAVSILAGGDENFQKSCFEYGRNLGMAFQLIDDLLDFKSTDSEMGKPTAADLKLGLATAPVLFACQKFPELNSMVMRRFSEPNDVEFAHKAVIESSGLQKTYALAEQHSNLAIHHLRCLKDCEEKTALNSLAKFVVQRKK